MWQKFIPAVVIVLIAVLVFVGLQQGRFNAVSSAMLEIRSNTDAQVFFDAVLSGTIRAGQVRQIADLSAGTHTISLSSLGFKTKSITLSVLSGQKLEQTFELEPEVVIAPKPKTVAFSDLEKSIANAADGAVLFLAAGDYPLKNTIKVQKSISLIGAGQTKTRVFSSVGVAVMVFLNAELHFKGISFIHTGKQKADVIDIKDSQINIEDCSFSGGFTSDVPPKDGDGLWLHGHSSGKIIKSRFERNAMNGLEIRDDSSVWLEHNEFNRNKSVGLSVWETAKVQVFDSVMQFNDKKGAQASNEASLTVTRNKIAFNKDSGLSFFGSATGSVDGNLIFSNQYGIGLYAQSKVSISKNTFEAHTQAIYVAKKARALIGQNTFKKNDQNVVYEK